MAAIHNIRYSNHVKAKHQQRCGCLLSLVAFLTFILSLTSLVLGLTASYSESKTAYLIIAAVTFVAFGVICGITVHQCVSGSEKRLIERNYKANLSFIQRHYLNAHINSTSQLNM